MARSTSLTDWNISLARALLLAQDKDIAMLADEINITREHLTRVFNRHSPLTELLGRRIAEGLGVSWDVIKKPESLYIVELINLSIVQFLQNPDPLDWKSAVSLADKMGMLSRSSVDTGEASEAQTEDEELLGIDDVPDVDWEDIADD